MRTHAVVAGIVSTLFAGAVVVATTAPQSAGAQSTPTVDFVRDVQPIFRQSCYGCHGPSQQMNGLRLDRRSAALRGGTIAVIGPGNSQASRMYLRLIGNAFGPQMPPTGALPPDQVAIIKQWIDEGAHWPDEASGEVDAAPIDAAASELVALLRNGDLRTVRTRMARNPTLVNARGPGGATPFMYATLYADVAMVRELLDRGADVNARSDAGATALMWAVSDAAKVRALIDRGADVNAKSDNGRTPLMIAAGEAGTAATVKLLLDKGADVNALGPSLVGQTTALTEAAYSGNAEAFRLLVAAGADLEKAGPPALGLALRAGCMWCADALMKAFPPGFVTAAMMMSGPPLGPGLGTPMFLERGAAIDARDQAGRSLLMLAAASDAMPMDAVKALLARKVDVNDRTANGETALGLARRHGDTPIVHLLLEAGARDEPPPPPPMPSPARSSREALDRALPLLQKADVTFLRKSGCVSCHNNSLTAMTTAAARSHGIRVDAAVAAAQAEKVGAYLESWRERALQGLGIPGDADTVSYILLGLAAERYPGNLQTDAQAYFLKRQQAPDGRWRILANRPPIESSDIQVTAASMRALQLYAPRARRAEYDRAVAAAATWLRHATPRVTEERVFQLLGLRWSNAPKAAIQQAGRALIAEQRGDGGWSQLPTMATDAYATGQALYALAESGALRQDDAAYRRGVAFLLKTQLADGSWFVRTRALPIQPLFDADFPHGVDAFISAAATNWAALAITAAVRD
ncbi:MAG TPA: ankyrin repeat domain-containing protein [Vicinamibacterales bacterium]|nr:ankyrin repeat domain-containing protein [Vicinamibacterales bacterium]